MEPLAAGTVALVAFPFSDLSQSKHRPALVLAAAGRADFILCQITSNPYADPKAVELTDDDFIEGSLQRVSYARPTKLFTAHQSLMRGRPSTSSTGSSRRELKTRPARRTFDPPRHVLPGGSSQGVCST